MRRQHRISFVFVILLMLGACAEAKAPNQFPVINGGSDGTGSGGGGLGGTNNPNPGGNPSPATEGRPTLSRIGDKVIAVGNQLMFTLMATDPQNDPISYNLRTELPEGASFNKGLALFTWTPIPSQANTRFLLTFEASDGTLKDQETISVEVLPAGQSMNVAPEMDIISDQALVVGQPWQYQVMASDPNGDPLTYAISGRPLPSDLIFDTLRGEASWTPNDVGSYDLIVSVTDGMLTSEQAMRLIVTDGDSPTAAPPQFIEQVPIEITLGDEVSFQLEVQYSSTEMLTFSMEQSPSNNAMFDPSTRVFRWVPEDVQAYVVVFMVTDGLYRDHMQVEILVNAPVVEPEMINCPTDPHPPGQNIPISSGASLSNEVLCMTYEKDIYTFTVSEESVASIAIQFDPTKDLDLYLKQGTSSIASSIEGLGVSEEEFTTTIQPGTYQIIVELYESFAATYSLQFNLTPVDVTNPIPVDCTDDRLESNDSSNQPHYLMRNLFGGLTNCDDEDWYETTVDAGYSLILYISSSDPYAYVEAQNPFGEAAGVSVEILPPTVDGCLFNSPRAHCIRAEIYLSDETTYIYQPTFSQVGIEYDLRVRFGDEVSSSCDPSLSYQCNPQFFCLDEFNGDFLGTCTRSCTSASNCDGSNRSCIVDQSGTGGYCFQTCQSDSDCRSDFDCLNSQSTNGTMVKVCR